jgi:5-methylcytosine-specific restriction protein A
MPMPSIVLPQRKKRDRTVNKQALQKFYNTPKWKNLRLYKFSQNPVCELCEEKGLTRQTEEIHHVIPIDLQNPDPSLIFDYDNLLSLCNECHSRLHQILRSKMNPVEAQIELKREVR